MFNFCFGIQIPFQKYRSFDPIHDSASENRKDPKNNCLTLSSMDPSYIRRNFKPLLDKTENYKKTFVFMDKKSKISFENLHLAKKKNNTIY